MATSKLIGRLRRAPALTPTAWILLLLFAGSLVGVCGALLVNRELDHNARDRFTAHNALTRERRLTLLVEEDLLLLQRIGTRGAAARDSIQEIARSLPLFDETLAALDHGGDIHDESGGPQASLRPLTGAEDPGLVQTTISTWAPVRAATQTWLSSPDDAGRLAAASGAAVAAAPELLDELTSLGTSAERSFTADDGGLMQRRLSFTLLALACFTAAIVLAFARIWRARRKATRDAWELEAGKAERAVRTAGIASLPNVGIATKQNADVAVKQNVDVPAKQNTGVAAKRGTDVAAKRNTDVILETVHQALFLIDTSGTIAPGHSRATAQILGVDQLTGANLIEILRPRLTSKTLVALEQYLRRLADPSIPEDKVSASNPLHETSMAVLTEGGLVKTQVLDLSFRRVLTDDGEVEGFLVSLTDVTEHAHDQRRLRESEASYRRRFEFLRDLLNNEPAMVDSFLHEALECVGELEGVVGAQDFTNQTVAAGLALRLAMTHERVSRLARNADHLGFSFIRDVCVSLEILLDNLIHKATLDADAYLAIASRIATLREYVQELWDVAAAAAAVATAKNKKPGRPSIAS